MSHRIGLLEQLESRDVPAAPFTEWPVLPAWDPATVDHVRRIAYTGELNGMRSNVFIKIGDSNTHTHEFFRPLGLPGYDPVSSGLAAFGADVLDTWATFLHPADAAGNNSFTRVGGATRPGGGVRDNLAALDADIAAIHPGVALILTGTNEHFGDPAAFRFHLATLIDRLSGYGTIPVLTTIPWDRFYVGNGVDSGVIRFNTEIVELATEKRVPLFNLWRALEPLPFQGLKPTSEFMEDRDFRHLTVSPFNPGGFSAADLQYAQNLRSLYSLVLLSQLRSLALEYVPARTAAASWVPLGPGQAILAAGGDEQQSPEAIVYDAESGREVNRVAPFEPTFRGGVRVAVGDVNGDTILDLVTAPGRGGGPVVRAFSGADGSELFSFFAYEPEFRGGVTIAVGDVDKDGDANLVVGAGPSGGPRVRVFRAADLALLQDYMAFDPNFRGGVTVAAGDFGVAVGAGEGGGPLVQVFDGQTASLVTTFAAYDLSLRDGVNIAAGDIDGDSIDEIVTGAGPGGSAHVRVFDAETRIETRSILAGDPTILNGVRVAVLRGRPASGLIVTSFGGAPTIRVFDDEGSPTLEVADPVEQSLWHGVFVAG